MYEKEYRKIRSYFLGHPELYFLLRIIYKYSPYPVFAAYPILLGYLFFAEGFFSEVFLRVLIIPAAVLITVSLLRLIINRKRPYEKYDIEPLIEKDTKGKSFPSRHAASVFIIALSFVYADLPTIAVCLWVLGIIMCLSRVLAGVHFATDVLAGMVYSIVFWVIGLFIF